MFNSIQQLISFASDDVNCVGYGDANFPSDGVNFIGYGDPDRNFCLVELLVFNSIQLVIMVPFNGLYFLGDGDPSVPSDEVNGIGYGVTVILIVKLLFCVQPDSPDNNCPI